MRLSWETNTKHCCSYFSSFSSKFHYSLPPTRTTGHPSFCQGNPLIQFGEVYEILITVALRAWWFMCLQPIIFSFSSKIFSFPSNFSRLHTYKFTFYFLFFIPNNFTHTGWKWTDSVKDGLDLLLIGTEASEGKETTLKRELVVNFRTGTEATKNLWAGS